MIYHCVHVHFYANGDQNAYCFEKTLNKKPENQEDVKYGITAFKIWLSSKKHADDLTRSVINKNFDLHEIRCLYTVIKNMEAA